MDRRMLAAAAAWLACAATLGTGTATPLVGQPRGQIVEIVSGAGKCLDVHLPDLYNNGGRVQVWQCNGSKQQEWLFDRGSIRSGAGKCLDVYAPQQDRDGAPVQIWDCNGTIQQRWKLAGKEIRSGMDKCLDVYAPDQDKDGARIQVYACNGQRQQVWYVKPKT